jgi:tetraprenyl-beta-curcumene synthase
VDKQTAGLAFGFLTRIVPLAGAEMRRLRGRASRIEDPAVRREALASMRHKDFHVHGGCILATFLDDAAARHYVRLVAVYETAVDYLDNLCDRLGAEAEDDFRALHEALLDAVTPGAPLRDYFRHRDHHDSGYLASLVLESQQAFAALPALEQARDAVLDVTARYADLQALKHLAPGEREVRCEVAFSSVAHDLRWWEGAAACGSTLPTFALAFAASSADCTPARVAALHEAYFPYVSGLHILLDYFIDQVEDREHRELNFVACYPDENEARAGIVRIAQTAMARASRLSDAERHIFALRAMCGYYCTRPAALRSPLRVTAEDVLRAVGIDWSMQGARTSMMRPLLDLYARLAKA